MRSAGPCIVLATVLMAGCSRAPETTYRPASPDPVPATAGKGAIVVPPGMSVGTAGELTPTPDLDARIGLLEKTHADKKKISAAYADRGYKRMLDRQASPRVMYPAALADFRHALVLDPANAKARTNKDMIEGIYRKMGRPVPAP